MFWSATLEWDDLKRELDSWAAAGRVAPFWWRDDDAHDAGPALVRLLDLADEFGVQIGLAAVPAMASAALKHALAGRRNPCILQHGYRHHNHATADRPAIECGGERPVSQVIAELQAGFRRLSQMFGPRFKPILAAPWNRIDPLVLGPLPRVGFRGVSAIGPRRRWDKVAGLCMANIHVDPLNWRGGARFAGRKKVLAALVGELRERRTGGLDPDEPLGILTHHRDHDEDTWAFLREFLRISSTHASVRWLGVAEVFCPEPGAPDPQARRAL